jgi:RimJ/RimL family protein N-acetyltransferase
MTTAPILETARLRLRGIRETDLDPWAAVMAEESVVRHLGGTPQTREESWRRLLGGAGAWALLGYGYWAVERRSDGALMGIAGLADFKRDMRPSIEGMPEAGWIFAPAGQGQGFATEAVNAALAWAETALPGREIAAIIDPANGPSIRVAEKCGFSREEATYKGEPILLFRRPPGPR